MSGYVILCQGCSTPLEISKPRDGCSYCISHQVDHGIKNLCTYCYFNRLRPCNCLKKKHKPTDHFCSLHLLDNQICPSCYTLTKTLPKKILFKSRTFSI